MIGKRSLAFVITLFLDVGLVMAPSAMARTAAVADAPAASQSPELSETTRLADRRAVVIGDRFYSVSTADGLYPAAGWHTSGEMGGFWTPPLKLLDGVWFGVDGAWLGKQAAAERFTAGQGYTRIRYA